MPVTSMIRSLALFALGLLPAAAAAAQDAAAPVVEPHTATKLTLDLGFVNAAGNTEVTTLSFTEALSVKGGRWEFKDLGGVVYGRTGDSTTAEQIKMDARIEVQVVSVLHVFVGGIYERNRFAGFDRRLEEYAGVAIKVIDQPSDQLTVEGGSSVNQDLTTTNQYVSFAALRAAALYRHNFTKTAYVQQTVELIPNLSVAADLRLNSESALVAPVAGRAAIKVAYAVKYDKLPEPGFRKTDRIFTTALQIVF
ncbi:MAG: DUF481 domain-containing protein [Gemmatimonadetes bacterium]|nr:DUF481 domain-containing protein [Gemmatimonadota bacterium]